MVLRARHTNAVLGKLHFDLFISEAIIIALITSCKLYVETFVLVWGKFHEL